MVLGWLLFEYTNNERLIANNQEPTTSNVI
jgi:hypothetical protein